MTTAWLLASLLCLFPLTALAQPPAESLALAPAETLALAPAKAVQPSEGPSLLPPWLREAPPSLDAPIPADEVDGFATWYGPGFHGRRTANGEVFDMEAMTAAHRTLPLGTWVEVFDVEHGRSVIVRINDRGPYKKTYVIDLSKGAARALGLLKRGRTRVALRVIGPDGPAPMDQDPSALDEPRDNKHPRAAAARGGSKQTAKLKKRRSSSRQGAAWTARPSSKPTKKSARSSSRSSSSSRHAKATPKKAVAAKAPSRPRSKARSKT
jgi:rare lipoprotein A